MKKFFCLLLMVSFVPAATLYAQNYDYTFSYFSYSTQSGGKMTFGDVGVNISRDGKVLIKKGNTSYRFEYKEIYLDTDAFPLSRIVLKNWDGDSIIINSNGRMSICIKPHSDIITKESGISKINYDKMEKDYSANRFFPNRNYDYVFAYPSYSFQGDKTEIKQRVVVNISRKGSVKVQCGTDTYEFNYSKINETTIFGFSADIEFSNERGEKLCLNRRGSLRIHVEGKRDITTNDDSTNKRYCFMMSYDFEKGYFSLKPQKKN